VRIVFYVLVTGISAGVTYGLAVVIWKLGTKYRLYPKIRERDVHTRPTPRLGGVAMFLGMTVAFLVATQLPNFSIVFTEPGKVLGLGGAALIIVLIGVADDIWDLDWLTKLAGQVIAAGILAWQGVQVSTLPIGGQAIVSPYVSLIITVFAIVLVMNAINFIDGLDGLVAGVALIANAVFFVYTYLLQAQAQTEYFNLASLTTAVLIGACLGFLPLNFHPAKLFMGDAGALLTGLLMAASAILVTGQVNSDFATRPDQFTAALVPGFIPILLPFAVLVVPLLDFGLAVTRRLRAGKSPFTADRKHLHHRLLDMGHSHLHAVLIFYGWTLVVSVGCLGYMFMPWYMATALIAVGLVILTVITLAPLSRRKALEAVAQSGTGGTDAPADVARYDGLDAASESEGSLQTESPQTESLEPDSLEPDSLETREAPTTKAAP
jgi:UDP-GlcNAc:undecaprenyl-phosphate GlcNAc-1-phosphate transferase